MQDAVITLGGVFGGAVLLLIFAWSWRGRSARARWWPHDLHGSDGMAMGVIPGAGLVLLGVAALRGLPAASPFGVAVIVVGAIVTVVGAVLPFLWAPRWYRDQLAREKLRRRRR